MNIVQIAKVALGVGLGVFAVIQLFASAWLWAVIAGSLSVLVLTQVK